MAVGGSGCVALGCAETRITDPPAGAALVVADGARRGRSEGWTLCAGGQMIGAGVVGVAGCAGEPVCVTAGRAVVAGEPGCGWAGWAGWRRLARHEVMRDHSDRGTAGWGVSTGTVEGGVVEAWAATGAEVGVPLE
jgi:hypothetical protein